MAPELTQGRSWVFSMTPAARYVGATLAWFLVTELAADSAASFFSADPFGQALDQGFFTEFERLGGAALNRVPFDSSLSRLDLFVGEARAAPALLVAGRPKLAARMIEALRVAGVAAPILLGAEPLPPDPRPARPQPGPAEPGAAGADSTGAAPQEGGGSDVYYPVLFDPGGRPVAEAFVERFTRSFGEPPHPSAALAYDAASLVLQGLEAGAADRTSMREWLEGMGATAPYAGVTGDFFFSQDHDAVRDLSIAARRAGGPVVTRRVASDPP